jgi:hydrogenase maturation protease
MGDAATATTVVLGVGNDLYRDEGVGVLVARALAEEVLPEGVTVIEGAVGGMNLLYDMEGAGRVILIDAVDMGMAPGTVQVFTPADVEMVPLSTVASLHQVGLEQVLALGELIGICPQVTIVGIQPQEIALGFGLTEVVAEAAQEALQQLRKLLSVPAPANSEIHV